MPAAATDNDDYASSPVPEQARTNWPPIFFATIGISTALIYMQVTSIIALQFGSRVALFSIAYASVLSALLGCGLARLGIRTGLGTSLLARFVLGYRGSAVFSLLFGATAVIYFTAEATIMAGAIQKNAPAISAMLLPLIALGMVPLVWFGLRIIARLQLATFMLYLALLGAALYASAHSPSQGRDWLHFMPVGVSSIGAGLLPAFGIMNGLIFSTALVTADYARYVRHAQLRSGCLFVGAGFQLICFAASGLLGLWFSTRYNEPNPGLYFATMLGGWGAVFAVATQLRINLANMYSGSIALVNFVRQITRYDISRHLVVLVFGFTACVAFLLNIPAHLAGILNVIGMFTTCFTCLLLTDLYYVRPLPDGVRFELAHRREDLPDWRFSALLSAAGATVLGCILETGYLGPMAAAMSSLIAGAVQIAGYCLLAFVRARRSARPGNAAAV